MLSQDCTSRAAGLKLQNLDKLLKQDKRRLDWSHLLYHLVRVTAAQRVPSL